jgi:hypothetical protein
MATKWRFVSLALIFILPLGVTFVSRDAATAPNSVEVICQLDSITTPLPDRHPNNHIVLPVYMTNIGASDSIFGFTLWVRSTWPELLRFRADSTVNDVVYAKFDTVGTRSGGFEFFDARIQDALHGQVKISAICEKNRVPPIVKPIPPGSGVLMNLIMETTEADSVCANMPILTVRLQFDKSITSFSNPASQTIGCIYVLKVDTVYGCCTSWNSDFTVCLRYAPPDSMCIIERLWCDSIDPERRVLIDGSNTFICGPPCQCGDANGDDEIDISDAVYLIGFIFSGGPAPGACGGYSYGFGDANGDGEIDISDAVYLISFIFSGGPAPHCQ